MDVTRSRKSIIINALGRVVGSAGYLVLISACFTAASHSRATSTPISVLTWSLVSNLLLSYEILQEIEGTQPATMPLAFSTGSDTG